VRLKWYKQHMAMKETSVFKKLKWRNIGPDIISWRCTDIAVPKGSQHTIYAGGATGGLWKTENSGISWEPIMDDVPSISIGDIAIDPSNPDIIWVGTGEANIFRASVAGLSGVSSSIQKILISFMLPHPAMNGLIMKSGVCLKPLMVVKRGIKCFTSVNGSERMTW